MRKYLRLCHAEDLTCLILAARDAFDPAAVDLGEVACIIDYESYHESEESVEYLPRSKKCNEWGGRAESLRPGTDQTGTVINGYELKHERRTAYYPHDELAYILDRTEAAH